MKYKIVEGTTPKEMADKVKCLLGKGWELQGGVSCGATQGFTIRFYQAMAKQKLTS